MGGVSDTGAYLATPKFMAASWWLEQVALANAGGDVVGGQRFAGVEEDPNDCVMQSSRPFAPNPTDKAVPRTAP
jgi:hypothetical protein